MPRVNQKFLVCYLNGKPDSAPHTTAWADLPSANAAASARRDELVAAGAEVGPLWDQVDGEGAGFVVPVGTQPGVDGAVIEEFSPSYAIYWNGPPAVAGAPSER